MKIVEEKIIHDTHGKIIQASQITATVINLQTGKHSQPGGEYPGSQSLWA